MKKLILLFMFAVLLKNVQGRQLQYPYPVQYLKIMNEGNAYRMAYMDVKPTNANGEAVILLHGKNFNGYYWKDVITALKMKGYRVIVPDQLGWGKSDKPVVHYSFRMLAHNTRQLLDSLQIEKVHVVGHSMGGMLAANFALMYPQTVSSLILENPIGLEDYSLFIPYQPIDILVENEKKSTYETMKKYQQTYYPTWKPEYEQYVQAQYDAATAGNKNNNAKVGALTYQMIIEQPVIHRFPYIKAPTLLIIGLEDRTVVGKNLLDETQQSQYGNYPALGKQAGAAIKNSKLAELEGVGHIPHIQSLLTFNMHLINFLQGK